MAQFNMEVNLPMYVGDYLKRTLRSRGITQEDFAEFVGVSDRTMRRWVSGDIHSLDAVSEIARALGVSVWDIFSNREDVPYHYIILVETNRTNYVLPVSFYLYDNN